MRAFFISGGCVGWIPDDTIAAMRGSFQLGIFLRIDTDPALHIWFGVNDIPARFDSIDADGTVYMGGGRLIGVPTLEVLVNGTADSVEFTLSGIDPSTSAKALDSIPPLRGAAVQLGIATLDQYYQPMGLIIPIWKGTASHVSEASDAVPGDGSPSITLSLSVVTGSVTRSRPSRSLWSDAMQKAISPTDDFCKQVQRLARGLAPVWPNY
ncbi:hypothetical protein [Rhizobium rhizogenes]|uniref:hypothetical protein n=2 Tax=Rhizobium rhizogenes TaxID=359 RepID=UPI0005A9A5CF